MAFLEKQCTDVFGPKFDLSLLEKGIRRTNANYGAKNIQVTNVVFVQGSIDPWHAMGLTQRRSRGDDVAPVIYIQGTAHCANMYPASESDPPQLSAARKEVKRFIAKWLLQ